ncbi:hypothetical protein NDU88_003347 [Pleurodeles waltl]|uniref:Uncharacterized protein n=1 Tax=Pleurodeles waltl TaxID=8319 RepID=A0AAV7VDX9_PLEWA|nr:hypothetical protein NDU88_003347 [Pleurodeles waltl]
MAHFNAPAPTKWIWAGARPSLWACPTSGSTEPPDLLEGRVRCTSPHRPCECSCRTPTARGVSPTDDGGLHDLPGWASYGLTYLRCTPELLGDPCPEGPELLGRISGDSETRVTASYPQRAAPIRQPILPFTGVPCFGSLHIVLTAHVPQTPGGIFICMCTQRGDGLLRRGEQNCWKRPDAGDYWTILYW